MPELRYRALLDASDVITKLGQMEQRFKAVGASAAIDLKITGEHALGALEARVKSLGANLAGVSGKLSAGAAAPVAVPGMQVGGAQQITELTRVINELTAALQTNAAQSVKNRAAFIEIDPAATNVARAIKQLGVEWRSGKGEAAEFAVNMQALRAQAVALAEGESLGSRNALVLASAIKTANQALGESTRQAGPYAQTVQTIREHMTGLIAGFKSGSIGAGEFKTQMTAAIAAGNALGITLDSDAKSFKALQVAIGQGNKALLPFSGAAQDAVKLGASVDAVHLRITALIAGLKGGGLGLDEFQQQMKAALSSGRDLGITLDSDAAAFKRLRAAMAQGDASLLQFDPIRLKSKEVAASLEQIRREVLGTRAAYQSHSQSAKQTIADLERLRQQGDALRGSLTVGSAEWLKLNQSMRTAAATMDKIKGVTPLLGLEDAMSGALKKLQPLLNTFGMFGGPLGSVLNQVNTLGSGFGGMSAGALAAVAPVAALSAAVLGLTAALAASVQQAIPFEAGLKQLQALTGIDSGGITEMGQRFQELSTELPITSNQFTEIARNAAMVGVHGKPEVLEFTEIMGKLGVLLRDTDGNMHDLEGTSRELAKFLNAAGVAGDAFIPALRESASELITLKTNIGGTIPEILNMSSYLVSIGTKMGLSTAQVLALSSAIASTGGKAQSSGHAIARIIEEMQEASIHGGAAADEYAHLMGLTADSFKELVLHNPAEAFKRLAGSIDETTKNGASIAQIFSDLGIKNVRLKQTIAEAAVAFPKLAAALGIAADAQKNQGDLAARAKIATSSYRDQIKELDGAIISLAQGIGLHFLPKMTEFVVKAKDFVKGFRDVANNADTLKGYAYAAATAVGALTTAMLLNSKAAKAMFAADAVGSAGKLFQGGLAAKAFQGLVGGVKDLQTAFSLASSSGGIRGVLQLLAAIPVGAAAALTGIALLAGGLAAYALKIQADTRRIQNQVADSEQKSFDGLMARVAKLTKAGDALSQQKAKYLLAIDAVQQAQRGSVVGSDIGGNPIYKVNPAEVAQAQVYLTQTKQKLDDLQKSAENASVASYSLRGHTKNLGDAARDASERFGELSDKLSDLSGKFADVKMTRFQQDLKQSRDELMRFRAEVERDYKAGNVSGDERKNLLKRASDLETRNVASLTQRQLSEDAKTVEGHQRELDAARLAIVKDGRVKREGEYQAEVQSLKDKYAPQIKEALQNAQAKGVTPAQRRELQDTAGALQQQQEGAIRAAQAKLNSDLADLDTERAKKVRDARTQNLALLASEMEGRGKLLQSEYKRQQALAEGDVNATLAIQRRLGSALEQQQRTARNAKLSADQAALRNELDDALRAAKDQGGATTQLQSEARAAYLSKSRALEVAYQADVLGYHQETLRAVQEAGAAVTKQQLDVELQGVKEVTGAQLAAYGVMLEAKKAAALADGDAPRLKVLAEALKTIAAQKFSNLIDFKKLLSDGVSGVEQLRQKLSDLNPNKDPLQAARSAAAGPFNSLISEAEKQRRSNQAAFGKLDPAEAEKQRSSYQQQQAELSRLMLDANTQRNVALSTADADFETKRLAKAQAAAVKLAKTNYERGQDSGPYLLVLEKDKAFWAARLKIAKEGSQEQSDAEQHLSDNESARKAVLDGDLQRAQQRREMTQAEAQSQLDLARTDAERAKARGLLLSLDKQRLASLPAEIAAAEAIPGNLERVNTLKKEQLALQKSVQQAGLDELARADQLLESQLKLSEAQRGYAATVARSNAEVVAVKEQNIAATQRELGVAAQQIATARQRGLTEAEVNGKLAEYLQKQGSLYGQQKELRDYLASLDRSALELLEARLKLEGQLSGAANDVVQAKQAELESTRRALAENARLLDADGVSEQERNDLLKTRLGLLGQELSQQREAAQLAFARKQSEADLLEVQQKTALQLSGMADDAVASAQLDVDVSKRKLAAKGEEIILAVQQREGEEKLNTLLSEQAALTGNVAEQERKVLEAQRQRAILLDNITQAQAQLSHEAAGGQATPLSSALDGVADTRSKLAQAEREYAQAKSDLNTSQNTSNLEKYRAATEALTGAIANQRSSVKALAETYRNQISQMDSVRTASEGLKKAHYGDAGAPFDANRELDRFQALEQRRAAAVKAAQAALASGDSKRIAETTQDLTGLEERYRKQAELLGKNGIDVPLSSEGAVESIAEQVDKLGLQFDREAAVVQQRADAAQKESEAAQTFGAFVGDFQRTVDILRSATAKAPLSEKPTAPDLSGPLISLTAALEKAVLLPVARPGAAPSPALTPTVAPQTRNVTITNNVTANVTTQPGQTVDPRALAREVTDLLNAEYAANGGCPP